MIGFSLFAFTIICSAGTLFYKKKNTWHDRAECFLGFLLLYNLGVMGLLAAYAHVFMPDQTAALIGWKGGSPFQYEIGMANLSFGILGILAFWQRGKFWDATIIGWNVLFLGCMVGHILNYYHHHNDAPYNIGPGIWLGDVVFPLLALSLLVFIRRIR